MFAMTEQTSDLTPAQIAAALKNRREYLGLSQRDMGLKIDPPRSGQAYSRFESGTRLKERDLETALKALDLTYDDLRDWVPGEPALGGFTPPQKPTLSVPVYGTPEFVAGSHVLKKSSNGNVIDAGAFFTGTLRGLQMPDDSMSPAIEQGQFVFFDLTAIPGRDDLAVIEINNEIHVRIYEKQDGSSVFVTVLQPERKTVAIPKKDVSGLYAVKFRGN